ncbi:hypothetical protein GQ600_5187 [Phytophthora cactorum]|nr:hypothetical protein GQ600_5187 [Phytophthora cactorum]
MKHDISCTPSDAVHELVSMQTVAQPTRAHSQFSFQPPKNQPCSSMRAYRIIFLAVCVVFVAFNTVSAQASTSKAILRDAKLRSPSQPDSSMDKRTLEDTGKDSASTRYTASKKMITSDESEERGLSSRLENLKNLLMRHPDFMDKYKYIIAWGWHDCIHTLDFFMCPSTAGGGSKRAKRVPKSQVFGFFWILTASPAALKAPQ